MANNKKPTNQMQITFKIVAHSPLEYEALFVTSKGKTVKLTAIHNPQSYEVISRVDNPTKKTASFRLFKFQDLNKIKVHLESAYRGLKVKFEGIEQYKERVSVSDNSEDFAEELVSQPKKEEYNFKEMNKKEVASLLRELKIDFDTEAKKPELVKLAKKAVKNKAKG